jgi:hypothetical protein
MTMLDEAKTNGHAEPATRARDARLVAIERRLAALPAEIAETSERRIVILRDALADFAAAELAKRDEEIVSLKKQLADFQQKLEQQAAIDQRVDEISARLEEKQARRETGKKCITDGDFIQTMGLMMAQERHSAREEFKAADGEMQRALEAKLAAVEERLKAVPGKLPVAKIWQAESVTYEGEIACYDGALYQSRKDTAQVPGGSDWIGVARAGSDGLSLSIRGAFDPHDAYSQLDVVTCNGGSFVARCDNPGTCPGPGWQLLSSPGKAGEKGQPGPPGKRGERGEKGEKGKATPTIVSWQIDRAHYRAVPTMSDGRAGATLDLRELFEQFQVETS